jgi:FemAB-related protein (PEP-CTERM system-associated)
MLLQRPSPPARAVEVRSLDPNDLARHLPRLEEYLTRGGQTPLGRHPAWLEVLRRGLGHVPYCLEAVEDGKTRGLLALAYVRSLLFGRFLVGLPYLNSGGVLADDEQVGNLLIDRAVQFADELDVRYLELRHEKPSDHPALVRPPTGKVHMRLALPATPGELWETIPGKARNQVRKGQKNGLAVAWGGQELLREFYAVFSTNMRDLGTPVYPRRLFAGVLDQFAGRAELCVVRAGARPVAGALLLHGWGSTEVPSASSLRRWNHTNANMLMYWHLLERAVRRGQAVFDFGRSSRDGNTFRFKSQWGARPASAEWQYYLRQGCVDDMRPNNRKYQRLIRLWQRLPVWLTRWLGPAVVRGIP